MASEASASRSIEAAEEWQKKWQTPTYLLLRDELNEKEWQTPTFLLLRDELNKYTHF